MIKLTQAELYKKLRLHKLWLGGDDRGERLVGGYDISGLNISGCNISGCDMTGCNMSGCDMRDCNMVGCNMSGCDMTGCNMSGCDMRDCNMSGCFMSGCCMSGCNMRGCNMTGCNMTFCDMTGLNMDGCNISGCDMTYAKNIPYIPLACPSHGSFIGWKKVNDYIIRLEIPEDAKRSSATTNKCRCDKARVIAIENIDGTDSGLTEITNNNYATCVYRVGEMVFPDSFDDNRWNECSHGIHFFINRQDAVNW